MSKLFFDHWLDLSKLEKEIKKVAQTSEEKIELWGIVDEIIHHRVMGCVLEHLPKDHHGEFMQKYLKAPNDEKLIEYLQNKIQKDVGDVIRGAISLAVVEVMSEILPKSNKKVYTKD